MVKSMFAAIAGLRTHQSKMDVISNNIANVNTWGYKSRSANFQDALYQNVVNSTGGNEAENGTGGVNASQLGYGVNLGSISTNYTQGGRAYTGSASNFMVNGTGFFIVGPMVAGGVGSDALSGSALQLSRVGILTLDDNGYLVDDQGNYVYGFNQTADTTDEPTDMETDKLQALQVPWKIAPDATATPPVEGERYQLSQIKIGLDGVITGVTVDTSETIVIGQVALASVENTAGLEQSAGYLYEIGGNAGQVVALAPGGSLGQILSGYLEQSNVDLATDMADMITTQRGYQANSKIITVTDEMLEVLVNMKR